MTHSIVLIFFFKQKTAYELRISDWSSDVCSSDLHVLRRQYEQPIAERHTVSNHDFGVRSLPRSHWQDSVMHIDHPVAFLMDQRRQFVHPSAVILIVIGIWLQIGRASCRERVLQYGWIVGGGGNLKKKKKKKKHKE